MNSVVARDKFEQGIIDNVRDHGCQVNFIFDPDQNDPNFSYSIGFPETVCQPETIVFGLRQEVMHFMINETLRECRDGLVLADWEIVEGLLDGHVCTARAVHDDWLSTEYFNSAMWYHRAKFGTPISGAFQLVWPGALDGLFPWDAGCDEGVRARQPALYEPRFDA